MVAKVCQALAYTQSSERIDEARVLSCLLAVRVYRLRWLWLCRARYLCGRILDGSYGFVVPDSCVGVSLTVAMSL